MKVREFLNEIQRALDSAAVRKMPGNVVIVSFTAPNSGFCGPTIRPKYLGESDACDGSGTWGRYGLTRRHVEKLLVAFDVTLPPEWGIR
jgi:hypothetical protein